MSIESLNSTHHIVETPIRVNVDVLKQKIIKQRKKEKLKRIIIFSILFVSLGALTFLTY